MAQRLRSTLAGIAGTAREHPVALAFGLSVALFLLVLATLTLGYQTNDDPAMSLRVAGVSKNASPSPYLIHSNMLLGYGLAALHRWLPSAPWYGVYLIACHALAIFAMLCAIARVGLSPLRLVFFLVYFAAIEVTLLVNLQFTTTAFQVCLAGVLLFLAAIQDQRSPLPSRRVLAASAALLLLGSLIRWQSFQLAVMLAVPAVAICLAARRDTRLLRRCLGVALVAGVVLGGCHAFDRWHYRGDDGWGRFYQYKKMMEQIIDFKNVTYTKEARHHFARVGWSRNDFKMARLFFYADYEHFSLEKMRELVAQFPGHKREVSAAQLVEGFEAFVGPHRGMLAIVLALMLFGRSGGAGRVHLASLGVTAAAVAGLVFFMKPPPERVSLAMVSYLAAMGVFFAGGRLVSVPLRGRNLVRGIALATLAIIAIALSIDNVATSRKNTRRSEALETALRDLGPEPDRLYVVWGSGFPWEWTPPFANLERLYGDFHTVGIGGSLPSPLTQDQLGAYGVEDLYTALVERDDVSFVIQTTKQRRLPIYRRYMREHYRIDVVWTARHEYPRFSVFDLDRTGPLRAPPPRR